MWGSHDLVVYIDCKSSNVNDRFNLMNTLNKKEVINKKQTNTSNAHACNKMGAC